MASSDEFEGFGENKAEGAGLSPPTGDMKFRRGVSTKITNLARGIKLPGAAMGPGGTPIQPGMLDGRGGAAGDVEYEEDWEERQAKQEAESRSITSPAEKLAKMLQASQVSRGIPMPDKNAIGLAAVMGGLKQTPHVAMSAPYVGEIAPGKKRKPVGATGAATATLGAAAASKAMGGSVASGPTGTRPSPTSPSASEATSAEVGAVGKATSPGAAAFVSRRPAGISVAGAGSGGVDEMQKHLDDSTIQWGLLRFTLGSGTFKRNKMILIHFNGDNVSGLHKAKLNRHGPEVTRLFGDTAAKLTMDEVADVTLDNVIKQTSKLFTADAHMDVSIGDIKSEYEQMLLETRRQEIEAMIKGDADTAKRQTAKAMGVSTAEALKLVHKPLGPFNWALFSIDGTQINLWDAGSLGVAEMTKLLPKDEILCGVVRMGFGTGKFRRTKWISLWWSGSEVGAHKRGSVLGASKEKAMKEMHASISMEGESPEDFSLEAIIDKVRRSAVIDGDGIDEKGNSWESEKDGGPFSLDAYYAALEEEIKENATYFGEKTTETRTYGMETTVREVRSEDGKYNWMLVRAD
eukprot:m.80055 g.80055  ORF g.80055 m.80055 type:complete len:576 (+) comp9319_c0_seq3:41-1768(+)